MCFWRISPFIFASEAGLFRAHLSPRGNLPFSCFDRAEMLHAVLHAVLMALWQRTDRNPVVLHSDCGCRFTNDEYQRFLQDHQLRSSMKESARAFECLADFSQADLFRRARPSFAPPHDRGRSTAQRFR
jgi:hypothetical protein